jgi:hypothetical protein
MIKTTLCILLIITISAMHSQGLLIPERVFLSGGTGIGLNTSTNGEAVDLFANIAVRPFNNIPLYLGTEIGFSGVYRHSIVNYGPLLRVYPVPRLQLSTSLRFHDFDEAYNSFSPAVSIAYNLSPRHIRNGIYLGLMYFNPQTKCGDICSGYDNHTILAFVNFRIRSSQARIDEADRIRMVRERQRAERVRLLRDERDLLAQIRTEEELRRQEEAIAQAERDRAEREAQEAREQERLEREQYARAEQENWHVKKRNGLPLKDENAKKESC